MSQGNASARAPGLADAIEDGMLVLRTLADPDPASTLASTAAATPARHRPPSCPTGAGETVHPFASPSAAACPAAVTMATGRGSSACAQLAPTAGATAMPAPPVFAVPTARMVRHCYGVGGEVTGLGIADRARAAGGVAVICHRDLPADLLTEFQRFADGTVRVNSTVAGGVRGPVRRRRNERALSARTHV